ncbi:MAG: HEAT repeat domain-containing protein [Deltaproteobacteria bacterium]|nr:HEAT repeat domain-containing protein [Deltaproteobacteria bacterium]
MRSRTAVVGLLVLAGAGLVAFLALRGEDERARGSALRHRYPAGARYRYALRFREDLTVRLLPGVDPGAPLTTSLDLGAELTLSSYGEIENQRYRLGVRLTALDPRVFRMGDAELFRSPEDVETALFDREALVDLTERGEIVGLRFPEEPSPTFERVLQLLISELQVRVADEPTWSALESTHQGQAESRYRRTTAGGDLEVQLERTRPRYATLRAIRVRPKEPAPAQTLAARAEIRFARAGHLVELRAQERLSVERDRAGSVLSSSSTTTVELLAIESFDGAPPDLDAYGTPRALAEIHPTEGAGESALIQRVEGMTKEQMLADLRQHGFGGRMPDHERWLWRVSGLLRLHPELCADLLAFFADPALGDLGRQLILDLLVGAGHAEAQAALRSALVSDAAKQDRHYSMLYQRLSLVKHPTDETLAFVEEQYRSQSGPGRKSEAYALGAAAGHRFLSSEPGPGKAIADRLLSDLTAARDPKTQATLLGALGNAGIPEHTPVLARFAAAKDASVRLEVAASLRKLDDPLARSTLIALAQDPQGTVQIRAVRALAEQPLGPGDVLALRDAVEARALREETYPSLVTLLQPYLERDAIVAEILRLILSQDLKEPSIKVRIRGLLGA